MDDSRVQCQLCKNILSSGHISKHLETQHDFILEPASFEEMQKLTYCSLCNVQWKTLDRAQKHLMSIHGCLRCWICFKVLEKKEMTAHYHSEHRENENSLNSCFSVRCRWCPKIIQVKNNQNPIGFHCQVHLSSLPTSKKRGRPAKADEFNFKVPVGPAPRRRSSPFQNSRVLGKICDPPNYTLDEVTKKCRLDLNCLPCISIQLPRLSESTVRQHSRKPVQITPVPVPDPENEVSADNEIPLATTGGLDKLVSVVPVLTDTIQESSDGEFSKLWMGFIHLSKFLLQSSPLSLLCFRLFQKLYLIALIVEN